MRDSLLKLIEVSIAVIRLLKVSSYQMFPYEDGAYVSIKVPKIIQPQKVISEAKGLEVCFYGSDDSIEIHIYESI